MTTTRCTEPCGLNCEQKKRRKNRLSFKLCRINVPELAGLLHAEKFHFLLAYALLISLSSLISASQSYEKPEGTACFEKNNKNNALLNVLTLYNRKCFCDFLFSCGKMHLDVPFVKLEVLM